MQDQPINRDLHAIVAADATDGMRLSVTFLLDRLGIEFALCEDVYEAYARALCGRRVLMIGAFEVLNAEGPRFFEICKTKTNIRCVCLFRGNWKAKAEGVIAAIEAGAFIAHDVTSLERIVERLSKKNDRTNRPGASTRKLTADEAALSTDELNALLGAG